MKYKYLISTLSLVLVTLASTVSCQRDKTKPNLVYMPNMYYSETYEAYSKSDFYADGASSRKPPYGTIKRGFVPYEMPNTPQGYELSKEAVKSPLTADEILAYEGKSKELYTIYCAACHGDTGDGKGSLMEKIPGVPSYADRVITEGSIFHVITYGKGIMGSHASQLTPTERWHITSYVQKLKSEL